MNYQAAVPPLPPPAAAEAVAYLAAAAPPAAGVAAGDPLSAAHVSAAAVETRVRKRLRADAPQVLSAEESVAAAVREHALLAHHAAQQYPGAGAPAWFGPAIENAIENAIRPLARQVENLTGRVDDIADMLNAKIENARIRSINLHCFSAGLPLGAVLKETTGHPLREPNNPVLAALQRPVRPGTRLPGFAFFPANGLQVIDLRNEHLNDLEWFYNIDLGPAPIASRRKELETYLLR
ncbi:hypothetical protein DFJ73DRAFT_887816 [Zopfochytrium polystomum]|nr:hypothetical protein DFJ73DRAFT_887816 [Zopfochytrium polystomum]